MTPKIDAKEQIKKVLKDHPEGLMLTEIAGIIGMNRFTVTKYIHELIGNGLVFQKEAAAAKICYLKKSLFKGVKEKEILEMWKERMNR